eukprot:1514610-Pyramimonas_sp.AAC.1
MPWSCVFCRVPVCSAVPLLVLPCSYVFCVICRAPASSAMLLCAAVLMCVLPQSFVLCRAD